MRASTTPARKERTARSTPAQRDLLQDAFERNPRPDSNEIQVLAEDIGMEPQHVSQWFSSKRCRMNKAFSKAATVSGGTPPPFYAPSPPTNALQLTLSGMTFPDSATPILIVAPKRPKPRVSPAQEDALQELFDRAPHATMDEKKLLAEDVGLTVSKVNSWFTFARATQLPVREHKALADSTFLPPISFFDAPPSSPGPSRTLRTRMRPAPYQRSSSYSDEYTPGKRTRSRPSPEQLVVLKREFAQHSNPSMEIRVRLSQELGMSVAKITDWFRNLRASLARQAKKKAAVEATPRSGDEDDELSLNLAIEAMDDMDLDPPPTVMDDDGDETESDDEPLPTPVFGGTPRLPLDVFSHSQTCSPRSSELRSTLSLAVDEEEQQRYTKDAPAPDADALLAAGILVGALRKGVRAPDVEIQLASQLAFLLEQKRAGSTPMVESRAGSEAPGVTAL
ncbi:hypothetical protein AURDEDRAFT_149650 [Auricularia subglabra TFB-10046 SS5]|nr:hypothetical protein AURDEDRAFT_149650 [Auricularia subglabra TFB-10046 SS5]